MAREHMRVKLGLWDSDDFLALSPNAQHLYFVLCTSRGLSYAGVHDWRPARLVTKARGWSVADIELAAKELVHALFIVIDEATEEVLIRSFVRNDGLMEQPNVAVSMSRALGATASPTLRAVMVHELVRLHADQPTLKGWSRVSDLLTREAIDPATLIAANPSARGSFRGSDNPSGSPSVMGSVDPSVTGDSKGSVNPSPTPFSLLPSPNSHLPAPANDAVPAKSKRSPDLLFDAIVEVCKIETTSLTPASRGPLNNARKQLADVGATPDEVRLRAKRYRQQFRDATLSPSALAKHWPALGGTGSAPMTTQELYGALSKGPRP